MASIDINQIIVPAVSTLFGAVGASYWLRRWIDKTDRKLDDIQNDIAEIKIQSAVSRKSDESTKRKIETIEKRLDKIFFGQSSIP